MVNAPAALWVAIYGAFLSTALALAKLLPEWPRVFPVAAPSGVERAISLQILNPAKRSLFIEGSLQLPLSKQGFRIIEQRPLDRDEDIVRAFIARNYEAHMGYRRSELQVYVPAETAALLTMSGIEEGEKRLIVFWWHRNWTFFRFCLPLFVRVSSGLASMVNRT